MGPGDEQTDKELPACKTLPPRSPPKIGGDADRQGGTYTPSFSPSEMTAVAAQK